MENEETIVTDPLGNRVRISEDLCDLDGQPISSEIYDDVNTAVEKPAFIIETSHDSTTELHYFRSIGWGHTLLLTARRLDHHWQAASCVTNPTTESLSKLLTKGKKIF